MPRYHDYRMHLQKRLPDNGVYRIDHQAIPQGCGSDSTCPEHFECSEEQCVPVVAACDENSPDTCREHCQDFALDLDSFGLFSVDGERLENPNKSLWLDYFSNAGGFDEPDQVELEAPSSENPSQRVPSHPLGGTQQANRKRSCVGGGPRQSGRPRALGPAGHRAVTPPTAAAAATEPAPLLRTWPCGPDREFRK